MFINALYRYQVLFLGVAFRFLGVFNMLSSLDAVHMLWFKFYFLCFDYGNLMMSLKEWK